MNVLIAAIGAVAVLLLVYYATILMRGDKQ